MNNDSKIKLALQSLNVNEFDQKVYASILNRGTTNVSSLARHFLVERPTIYSSLDRLQHFGLMPKRQDYSRKISVEPPNMILALIEKQKNILQQVGAELERKMPEIMLEFSTKNHDSSFRMFEGREQFLAVFEEAIQEAKEEILFFGDVENFVSYEGVRTEKAWIKKRLSKKLSIRLLVKRPRDTEIDRIERDDLGELRQTKYLLINFNCTSSFLIYGYKTLLWNTLADRAIVIGDPIITEMFKQIFEKLWKNNN
ncbi:hypothetical protein A2215_00220 [Candidatus Berkelbacteria bacterium RIFOXYA2_FULL_43_10]|uniref:Transcription regulator TrmB N-terminal domain-containing protein n=1 Tax=Candidatus Berkelbacteria bacterium RIFOXYA2_FULL_43_10 TaxID=1797472 RepID=A0A1F5EDB2_9BACT|nr:MAG: hypothetical protein A2215_00220 [Candidatus Berkelbacteria bacterium RIFOXYA2_FULL_43_10]